MQLKVLIAEVIQLLVLQKSYSYSCYHFLVAERKFCNFFFFIFNYSAGTNLVQDEHGSADRDLFINEEPRFHFILQARYRYSEVRLLERKKALNFLRLTHKILLMHSEIQIKMSWDIMLMLLC